MWWLIPLIMKAISKKGGAAGTAASVMGSFNQTPMETLKDTDIASKIAQNQIWGQNELAGASPYDPYSPFANPESQTMGIQGMQIPNPQVGLNLPGQAPPAYQDSLFTELIKKYLQSRYGWR